MSDMKLERKGENLLTKNNKKRYFTKKIPAYSMDLPDSCSALFLFVLGFQAWVLRSQPVTCNSEDLKALIGFSNCLESAISGWNSPNCCSWTGVTCDNSSKRVIGLELASKRLTGVFCKSLADLDHLRVLNLSQNFLRGNLPAKLLHLQHLEVLDLSSNDFTGLLPASSDLPSIQYLNISMNKLNGLVDATLCETSPHIQVLDISKNQFSGEISTSFGRCTSLQHLFLDSNGLSGSFPVSVLKLQSLRVLHLEDNRFSGPLIDGIGKLSNLEELDISSNGFSGTLPDIFWRFGKLKQFSCSSNKFNGHLPKSLMSSASLVALKLNNNTLNGPINFNCSAMDNLVSLNLASNNFQGKVLESLSSCQKLRVVNLSRNKFGVEVPYNFKNLQALTFLSLANASLANISAALSILQHCKNLSILVLSTNFQDEQMPGEMNLQFENLKALIIPYCHLRGSVPSWLKGCKMLEFLDLSWNHLDGSIPFWIGNFKYLFYLDFSNNSFTGEMPSSLTELAVLINGNISLEGTAVDVPLYKKPEMGGCVLQYNTIWRFPPTLDLSFNKLTGPILPSFGNLKRLHVLCLHHNNLSGPIPNDLSEMSSLEVLDLSHNKLSGELPGSLIKLNFLSEFDVSYNQLTGEIPTGGQFTTFPNSSFEGNKGLCGQIYTPCQPAQTPSVQFPEERIKVVGIPFGIGAATGFVISVAICFMCGLDSSKG